MFLLLCRTLHKNLYLPDKVETVVQITVTCDCNALSTGCHSHNGAFPHCTPRLKTDAISDCVMHDIQSEAVPLFGVCRKFLDHVHIEIRVL